MQPFLREVKDFFRFFWLISNQNKEIVFYAEHNGYYPAFEGLIQEITKRHHHHLCYVTSSYQNPLLKKTIRSNVTILYVNKLLPIFMALITCRVVVMTMPDLNTYHIKRSIYPVHYVYIFHSLVSTHMMYQPKAFDHYDSILCAGPHHIKEIRHTEKKFGLTPKELIPAGYYRLERIYQKYQAYRAEKPATAATTVLIAPSWGEKNIIERFGLQICTALVNAKYNVILRPHPQTVANAPKTLKEIELKLGNHKNFKLEKSVASDKSLFIADLMICDLSGVAIEYALGTERPVLFIDIPPKIKNPDYQDLGLDVLELSLREKLGVVIAPEKTNNIVEEVSKLLSQKHTYREYLAILRNQVVYNFGSSSKVGAKHIINKLANDSK